jgi:ABC-2 type transport system ATP-binding protein
MPVSARLPDLAGAHVAEGGPGERLTVYTTTIQDTLTEVLLWARQQGVELRDLDARSASLEEAFMAVAKQEVAAS